MKHLVSFGFDVSPRAYQDAQGELVTMPPTPQMAVHEFHAREDGQLEHRIDGQVRAIVPPEGLETYWDLWPDARPVIRELVAADHV